MKRLGKMPGEARFATEGCGEGSEQLSPPGGAVAQPGEARSGGLGPRAEGLPGNEYFDDFPVDLFGEPITPAEDCRGRPPHVPTDATRETVRRLRGEGRQQRDIAKAVGLTVPTLHRHYPEELESTSQARRRWLESKEK